MTAYDRHRCHQVLTGHLHDVLAAAQCHRPTTTVSSNGTEPAWVATERAAMIDAVNHARAKLGLSPCRTDDIRRAEQSALGHTDYTAKWALYCADTIIDDVTSTPTP